MSSGADYSHDTVWHPHLSNMLVGEFNEPLIQLLRKAERRIVGLYNGFAPGGRYDDENRFADLDPVVSEIRECISSTR
jgi:hypothetical protein